MERQLRLLAVPLMCFGFMGCNGADYSFSEKPLVAQNGDNAGPGTPPVIGQPSRTCSTQLTELSVPAKILFVVDTSGSNATENNGVGTDKDKSYRSGSIQKFFNDYSVKSNFNWGMIRFSYSEATSYIGDTFYSPSMFSTRPSDMQEAMNNFASTTDEGDTPYVAAIRKAGEAIAQDITIGSADTKYIVVFVSDGLPSPAVANSVVYQEIMGLMSKAPGRISFNTVFYGTPTQGGSTLMQGMANAGSGQFLDTNAGGMGRSFPISNVVQIPGQVCDMN